MTATSTDTPSAQAFLFSEGIGFPELPPELSEQLRIRSAGVYSTCELTSPLHAMEAHIAELLSSKNKKDYAVLGIDGDGADTRAFHYFLVSGPLALFVQLPWAGGYKDNAPARKELDGVLDWAAPLLDRLSDLQERGRLGPEQRLLVVISRFSESRWTWTYRSGAAAEDIVWRPTEKIEKAINAEMKAMAK